MPASSSSSTTRILRFGAGELRSMDRGETSLSFAISRMTLTMPSRFSRAWTRFSINSVKPGRDFQAQARHLTSSGKFGLSPRTYLATVVQRPTIRLGCDLTNSTGCSSEQPQSIRMLYCGRRTHDAPFVPKINLIPI